MSKVATPSNVAENRAKRKWPVKVQIARVTWAIAVPLFRFSPRIAWGWRRWLLRIFGADIGKNVHVHPTVRILMPWNVVIEDNAAIGDRAIIYALGRICVGRNVTVSQGVHLCAGSHDWRDPTMPLLKSSIEIQRDAWICADAFIGPDVTIGAGSIVGARGVAMRDVGPMVIVAGNPVQVIGLRT